MSEQQAGSTFGFAGTSLCGGGPSKGVLQHNQVVTTPQHHKQPLSLPAAKLVIKSWKGIPKGTNRRLPKLAWRKLCSPTCPLRSLTPVSTVCHPSPPHQSRAHRPERQREDPLLSGIQQAHKESVPIVSHLGTASPTPPGRGQAPVPGVAPAEGTCKVFSPLTQPNRAGITCSIASQRAKAFFTVFCLGTTPSPRIEKPQHADAMEKSQLCRFLPGAVLTSLSLDPQSGRHLPWAGYPQRKTLRWPSASTPLAGGSLLLEAWIRAGLARWVQLPHIVSARKKEINCDFIKPDQSFQTLQQGHKTRSNQTSTRCQFSSYAAYFQALLLLEIHT